MNTNINNFKNIIYNSNNIVYYRFCNIPNFNIFNKYMRSSGIPLFNLSYDIYAFMIVFMSDFSFYSSVLSNTFLSTLWRSMWVSDQFENLSFDLYTFHSSPSLSSNSQEIFKLLSKYSLRYDILDHLLSQFK